MFASQTALDVMCVSQLNGCLSPQNVARRPESMLNDSHSSCTTRPSNYTSQVMSPLVTSEKQMVTQSKRLRENAPRIQFR